MQKPSSPPATRMKTPKGQNAPFPRHRFRMNVMRSRDFPSMLSKIVASPKIVSDEASQFMFLLTGAEDIFD